MLYITYTLNATLMIALGFGWGLLITRRYKMGWRLFWIGGAIFVISQVFHIPFNALVTLLFKNGVLPAPAPEYQVLFNAVFLGLSAGIFEEVARYLGYRYWAKEARTWSQGLLYGAGHGGIEAILLGIFTFYITLQFFALKGQDLSKIVPLDQLPLVQQQVTAFWSTPWYLTILGAVERALTIPVQITFAIIVLQAFTRAKIYWVFIAIFWHALLDASVYYVAQVWNVYLAEITVLVFTVASLVILYLLYRQMPHETNQTQPPPPPYIPIMLDIQPLQETSDKIEDTRYIQ
jgi:uncharacterized membrane protein YhfC